MSAPEEAAELERRIADLRLFEREYRTRLRAYLQGLLRDLDDDTDDNAEGQS
jgi:hypothetical protein